MTGYQLRLPSFEGPLDVLLRLIERSHMAITDVSLVTVTEQFLEHLGAMTTADPEVIAEFATVAARLVMLKSRSLLPKPVVQADEETSDLARELIEFQELKRAAKRLETLDRMDAALFVRGGAVVAPTATGLPPLARHDASALVRAVRRRLIALPVPLIPLPLVRRLSIQDAIERLLVVLDRSPTLSFAGFAEELDDPSDVRTAFLALLLLIRRRTIEADQSTLFDQIEIRRLPPPALASTSAA